MRVSALLLALTLAGCGASRVEPDAPTPIPVPAPPTFEGEVARLARTFARAGSQQTVAVLEFPDLGDRTSDLSRLVSEELTTALAVALGPKGRMVERRQVMQVLRELDLAKAALTGEEMRTVGRRLGATAILLGSTAVVARELVVNARMVGVAGLEVLAADRMQVAAPDELLGLARGGRIQPRGSAHSRSAGTRATSTEPVLEWSNGDLRVELLGITHRPAGTVVTVLLTNVRPGPFKVSFLRRWLYLVDDQGIRYDLVGGDGFAGSRDAVARHVLIPEVPRRFELAFEGGMEDPESVTAVLNLGYGGMIGCCAKALATMGPAQVAAAAD